MKWMSSWLSHSSSPFLQQFLPQLLKKSFPSHTSLFKIRATSTASEGWNSGCESPYDKNKGKNVCGRSDWRLERENNELTITYQNYIQVHYGPVTNWLPQGKALPPQHLHRGQWDKCPRTLGDQLLVHRMLVCVCRLLQCIPQSVGSKELYYDYYFYIANTSNIAPPPPICSLVYFWETCTVVFWTDWGQRWGWGGGGVGVDEGSQRP